MVPLLSLPYIASLYAEALVWSSCFSATSSSFSFSLQPEYMPAAVCCSDLKPTLLANVFCRAEKGLLACDSRGL